MGEEDKKAEPPKDIAAELMSAVTYVYLNPIEDKRTKMDTRNLNCLLRISI